MNTNFSEKPKIESDGVYTIRSWLDCGAFWFENLLPIRDSSLWASGSGSDCASQNPAEAIEVLRAALPYDMADLTIAYLRGQAYLAAHQGPEAVAEFQKIVDNNGTAGVDIVGALALLGLGRAHAMAWETDKAKTS